MFVDFFIRRPVFATVCALFIILAGAISIPTLPIAQFPNLAPPQVLVTSIYIGANAQTVESAVTIPLEQAINGVPSMKYITSTSGNDGSSAITVTFDVTRDVDLAAVDVQNRVSQALGRLPNAVNALGRHLGVGFEYGFAPNWSIGAEYDHLWMGNANNSFSVTDARLVGILNDRISQDVDMVTLRINYRFGGYGAPVTARY